MSELSDAIRGLRKDGLSYRQIQEKLGCSKGTISYYLGDEQKKKRRKRQRDKRNSLRKEVAQIKADATCADCGIDYPPHVMDFDHVRGEKVGNISELVQIGIRDKLLEEIEKCEIVCSNCHRERTYERLISSGGDASALLVN